MEIKRQIFHIVCGIIIIALVKAGILSITCLGIIIIIGFIISAIYRKYDIPGIRWFLKHFERKKNMKTFPGKGAIFYLLGCFFALLFFRQDVAFASIMIMALGDSVSTLFSRRYQGKIKHPFSSRKYLEGALMGGLAGFFGAMVFVSPLFAFISSFISMIIEGIDIRLGFTQVDDNLILPIVAGAIITLLEWLF